MALGDDKLNSIIVHYGYNHCKRVSSTVMSAEVHGIVKVFEFSYIVRQLVSPIIG